MSTRALLRATAGGLVGVAVVLPGPAVARITPARSPSPLLRQHYLGGSTRIQSAVRGAQPSAAAVAAAHLGPCKEAGPDGLCGTVDVPLDRADPSRGTIPIFFEYFPHRDPGPSSEAILSTAGGPGSSITQDPFLPDVYRNQVFSELRGKRDLIFLDQRGTGRSGAIDCEQVQHGSTHIYRDVRACGKQLGFAAPLYGSADVALDIEAVRKALAIEKLDFYGGSYAGQDIQAYAVRFPGHLRSAVLDAPSTSLGFDDFDPTSPRSALRSVRLVCARSQSCAAERRNPVRTVAWLARRLRRQPVDGVGRDANGRPHHVRVTEGYLLWRLLLSDAGGFVSVSEIGAAAEALRAGDPVPLRRLAAEEAGPVFGDEGNFKEFSVGDNFARFCTDNPMPWDKNASIPTRLEQWQAARRALSRKAFAPFSIRGWLAPLPIGPIGPDACIDWPAPKRQIAPPVPRDAKFPATVPALILNGDLDLSSTSRITRRVAKAWPNSRFVEIANSGHTTVLDGRGDCAQPIVVHFIATLRPGDTSCASQTQFTNPAVGRFARTAADARPAKPGGDYSTIADRKVAAVAAAAVTDAFRRAFRSGGPGSGAGLRGGTFRQGLNSSFTGVVSKLSGLRFARDVAVSGSALYRFDPESIDAKITVDGPGREDGKLHVTGIWFALRHTATVLKIEGKLAGHRVALSVPAT